MGRSQPQSAARSIPSEKDAGISSAGRHEKRFPRRFQPHRRRCLRMLLLPARLDGLTLNRRATTQRRRSSFAPTLGAGIDALPRLG